MTELHNQAAIIISTLPQVTTAEEFFSIERMIMPIVIPLIGAPDYIIKEAMELYSGIVYEEQTYIPTALFGSPENLFLRVKDGMDVRVGKISFTFRFHGELDMLLESELVYDASGYDEKTRFDDTQDFYIEKCIKNDFPTVR